VRKFIGQARTAFTDLTSAISSSPSIGESIVITLLLQIFCVVLLVQNALGPDATSVSPFPSPVAFSSPVRVAFSFLVQILSILLPVLVFLGKKGLLLFAENLALINFIGFCACVIGLIYQSVFWPMYKLLPLTGILAKAIYESVFLIYPVLVLFIFRYVLLWMLAKKTGASTSQIFLLAGSYLLIAAVMSFVGGLI